LSENEKAGRKEQIAKGWTAHGVNSIGNAREDDSFPSRAP
jgi:hypothetical protein